MTTPLTRLWRENRVLFACFALSCALTVFFAARLVAFWIYWADPTHRDQAIAGWMTPRYVAHSWDAPPEMIAAALDLERGRAGRPLTLAEIAAGRGESVESIGDRLEAAIAAHRAQEQ